MVTGEQVAVTALHRRIDEIVKSTGLTAASSITDVLTAVARHRGRAIELEPLPVGLDVGHLFGVCLPYPDRDVVLYRTGGGAEHELHNTLHECGHLLLDHVAQQGQTSSSTSGRAQLARLLPDLDLELVAAALGRSSYEDAAEQEAEAFAMRVRAILAAQQRRRGDAILARFDSALG